MALNNDKIINFYEAFKGNKWLKMAVNFPYKLCQKRPSRVILNIATQ